MQGATGVPGGVCGQRRHPPGPMKTYLHAVALDGKPLKWGGRKLGTAVTVPGCRCADVTITNLGACWGTQFPTDLLKDPFLSSVCVYVSSSLGACVSVCKRLCV